MVPAMSNPEPSIFVKQIPIGPMKNFSYLVGARNGDTAIIIDPGWEAQKLIEEGKTEGRTITALLVTHTHYDHVNAAQEVATALTIPIYVHEHEVIALPQELDIRTTKEGSIIEEAGLSFTCYHTPGHSPGSQCFLVENVLFTGDTLFVDSCGRVDLEGGNPDEMMQSLHRLSTLPENIIVYCGHDYGKTPVTTIDEQKRDNPHMKNS